MCIRDRSDTPTSVQEFLSSRFPAGDGAYIEARTQEQLFDALLSSKAGEVLDTSDLRNFLNASVSLNSRDTASRSVREQMEQTSRDFPWLVDARSLSFTQIWNAFDESVRIAADKGAPLDTRLENGILAGIEIVGVVGGAAKAVKLLRVPRIPLGFSSGEQFSSAAGELAEALQASGLSTNRLGVRGSAVTNISSKGGSFRFERQGSIKPSDIDFFFEATDDLPLKQRPNIPGFVHPRRINRQYPAVQAWSQKWSKELGREVTAGGFNRGTFVDTEVIDF